MDYTDNKEKRKTNEGQNEKKTINLKRRTSGHPDVNVLLNLLGTKSI